MTDKRWRTIGISVVQVCAAAALFVVVGYVAGKLRFPQWAFYVAFGLVGLLFILAATAAALNIQDALRSNNPARQKDDASP